MVSHFVVRSGGEMGDVAASVMLRPYRSGDADGMYELDRVCFEEVFQFSRRTMRGFAEAQQSLTVVAEAAGVMIGFAIGEYTEDGALYVVTLDVHAGWRRGGVARGMMEWLEREGRAAGVERMELHVYAGNEAAIRFYEGIGFSVLGRVEGFYGPGMDGWRYGKGLG